VIERSSILVSRERLEDMAYLQKYGVGISIHFLSTIFGGASPGLPNGEILQNTWLLRPFGFEVKYRFTRHFTAGLGYSMVLGSFKYFDSYPYVTQGNSGTAPIYQGGKLSLQTEGGNQGFTVSLTFYGVYPFSRRFNVFGLIGIEPMLVPNVITYMKPMGALPAGPEVDQRYHGLDHKWKAEVFAVHLGAGVEYYVRPRLALSLRAYYTWAKAEINTQPQRIRVDMSGIGITPTVSLYF
jgi:opacity protein-like surface antigen